MVRLPIHVKTGEIVVRQAFATPNEVEVAGRIGSFAETEMLSTYDIVYLDFKDRARSRLARATSCSGRRRSTTRAAGSFSAT